MNASLHMPSLRPIGFGLEFDPDERHNPIANPKYGGVLQHLQKELTRLMRATGLTSQTDKMPLDGGIQALTPRPKNPLRRRVAIHMQ